MAFVGSLIARHAVLFSFLILMTQIILFLLQLCEKFEAAISKINLLESENKKLREETQKYDETQKNVQKNISSLLITARTELSRKEREIKNLRYLLRFDKLFNSMSV